MLLQHHATSAGVSERTGPSAARWVATAAVAMLAVVTTATPLFAQVRGTYLYTLSNFGGRIPYAWARVVVDQEREESYVQYGNLITIFNASGMEIYRFGDDLDVGQVADVAVNADGDIIVLSHRDTRPLLTRCDFRGVPVGSIEIKNLPESLEFSANRMVFRNGLFYFVTTSGLSVIVTDANGEFRERIDLMSLVQQTMDEKERRQTDGAELTGFTVDGDGNIYFTVAVLFKVYKLTPDKKIEGFGRSGSAPGRFSVIAGVAVDSRGNIIVADKLKCAIMVFDKNFSFINEFGYRGNKPSNLILPDDLAIDKRDRVYVTQARRRGVSVFALAPN